MVWTAANSLGLGTVPIGGIRNNPQEVIEFLGLPPYTFAMIGLCLGYVNKPSLIRPRLPISTFRHDECYNLTPLRESVATYNEELVTFWASQGRTDGKSWSEAIGPSYSCNERPKIRPTFIKQGMTFQD